MNRMAVLTILCVGQLSAATISFTLDQPMLNASPGDLVSFTGIISNTGSGTIFLNSALGTLPYPDVLVDYGAFFTSAPPSLDPGQSYSGAIFGVAVGLNASSGEYLGSFAIQGGGDSFTFDDLATQSFQVTVSSVPEPATGSLLVLGLMVGLLVRRALSPLWGVNRGMET
jgi:hypothetical protein